MMPVKYGTLQKELVEEAQLLLAIIMKTLAHAPDDDVTDSDLAALQDEYHATEPQKPASPRAGTGRARITC